MLVVLPVALLLLCGLSCADPEGDMMMKSRKKKTSPRLRLNSVSESNTSNSPKDERKGRKRHVRTQAKPKNPQKNTREKKWVEAVATTYRELRSTLGAGDESRRTTTKVEMLQVSV